MGSSAEYSAGGPSSETKGKQEGFYPLLRAWIECFRRKMDSFNKEEKLKIKMTILKPWQRLEFRAGVW
jgi:hypothetical protein